MLAPHGDQRAVGREEVGVLDRVGNAQQAIPTRDAYVTPTTWLALVDRVGGTITKQLWPLDVHDAPIRTITRSELQFAARVERHAPG